MDTGSTVSTVTGKGRNMGRPKASDVSRNIASLFANVVTVPSSVPNDWVARTGDHSIFNVLCHLIPKVRVFSAALLLIRT